MLPTADELWVPPEQQVGRLPSGTGSLEIEGVGDFSFNAGEVETLRSDIFQQGHFSLFDTLVHLDKQGDINLEYHFDEAMNTHVIDAIEGQSGWWYRAHYSGGWFETNAFRMDMYPYKDGTNLVVFRESNERLERIYGAFREEVARLEQASGQVVIPEIVIESPKFTRTFRDVPVTAHDVRKDMLRPGVVTALDVILSLAEQGELSSLKLTWYGSIAGANPVDSYWLEKIDGAEASGGCGFVYETGSRDFSGFSGSHIHIPADVRVMVSPEYALWFWICL